MGFYLNLTNLIGLPRFLTMNILLRILFFFFYYGYPLPRNKVLHYIIENQSTTDHTTLFTPLHITAMVKSSLVEIFCS